MARDINVNIPVLDALISKRTAVVVVPILPLSFLPRRENKAETSTANALPKTMEFKIHADELSRASGSFKLNQATFESTSKFSLRH